MLVLTRKPGEAVRIITPDGEHIDLEIVNFPSKAQVRVGVEAPRPFKIHRINRAGMIEKEPRRETS